MKEKMEPSRSRLPMMMLYFVFFITFVICMQSSFVVAEANESQQTSRSFVDVFQNAIADYRRRTYENKDDVSMLTTTRTTPASASSSSSSSSYHSNPSSLRSLSSLSLPAHASIDDPMTPCLYDLGLFVSAEGPFIGSNRQLMLER